MKPPAEEPGFGRPGGGSLSGSVVNTRLSVIYRAIAAIVFLSIAGMAAFGMPNAAFARSSAASRSARYSLNSSTKNVPRPDSRR